jgi:hypothetical protein
MDNKTDIILPNMLVHKYIAKVYKLLKQITIEEEIFMRPTATSNYDPSNAIKSIRVIHIG